jgi:hypothetical protein
MREGGPGQLSAQREDVLLEAMLREQIGIDPNRAGAVFELAAVGIVNGVWRNGPVEDWHSSPGVLSDGAMLRINAHTTWRVREIVRRWRAKYGMAADAPTSMLDAVEGTAIGNLAYRLFRWLVAPMRRLPIGTTLAELAGTRLDEFTEHAENALAGVAATAESRGAQHAMWRAAAHGGLACPHWWGTPSWPEVVTRFLKALDTPHDPHWGDGATGRAALQPEPSQVADRKELRKLLRRAPWELDADAAEWLGDAGIGAVRSASPPPPGHTVQEY